MDRTRPGVPGGTVADKKATSRACTGNPSLASSAPVKTGGFLNTPAAYLGVETLGNPLKPTGTPSGNPSKQFPEVIQICAAFGPDTCCKAQQHTV